MAVSRFPGWRAGRSRTPGARRSRRRRSRATRFAPSCEPAPVSLLSTPLAEVMAVVLGSLHGTWRSGGLHLSRALSGGGTSVDIERSIRLGPTWRLEHGSTSAAQFGAELDLGWLFRRILMNIWREDHPTPSKRKTGRRAPHLSRPLATRPGRALCGSRGSFMGHQTN